MADSAINNEKSFSFKELITKCKQTDCWKISAHR